ncbi:MAG: hypothetical protein WA854_02645, partial [Candidatus Binataceae bacterium]
IASATTKSGPITMRIVAIRMDATHIYRFRFMAPSPGAQALAPAFAKTAGTFKRLSAAEAALLKPRKLKLVTVAKNDTVATLAKRCAFDKYPQEQFRAMNGLAPGSTQIPLQQVKLVVE